MADLHKFHRSKERIAELLNYLNRTKTGDDEKSSYIRDLEKSIEIIDSKIEEFEKKETVNS
jgi:hypothetical protein